MTSTEQKGKAAPTTAAEAKDILLSIQKSGYNAHQVAELMNELQKLELPTLVESLDEVTELSLLGFDEFSESKENIIQVYRFRRLLQSFL